MAHAEGRQGALGCGASHPRPGPGTMPGMSPLSETLWRDRTNTEKVGDISARLTWVDLWVTIVRNGAKQSILQGLTGNLAEDNKKNLLETHRNVMSNTHSVTNNSSLLIHLAPDLVQSINDA